MLNTRVKRLRLWNKFRILKLWPCLGLFLKSINFVSSKECHSYITSFWLLSWFNQSYIFDELTMSKHILTRPNMYLHLFLTWIKLFFKVLNYYFKSYNYTPCIVFTFRVLLSKVKALVFFNNNLFYLGIIIILVQPILKKRYYVPRYRLRIISAPLKTKKFPSIYR